MHRFPVTHSLSMLLALLAGISSGNAAEVPVPPTGPIPFAAFDKDGSGYVSKQEFEKTREERISARAAIGIPTGNLANAPGFSNFDIDMDGLLSPAELSAGQQAHVLSHRNRPREPGQTTGMNQARNMPSFTDFDLNGDGKIVAKEFDEAHNKRIAERAQQGQMMKNLAHAPSFDQLDTDKDGAISPDEFAHHQAQRHQQKTQ